MDGRKVTKVREKEGSSVSALPECHTCIYNSPGSAMPIASTTELIVLAVNIPPAGIKDRGGLGGVTMVLAEAHHKSQTQVG